jgi:hypothetical protein
MSQTPNPVNRRTMGRATAIGIALAAAGIALFVIVWLMLEGLSLSRVPRLFIAICLPPAVIAGLIGLYVLLVKPRSS